MVAAEAGEAEEAQSAEAEQLMNLRMQEIFSAKGNKACADCPAKKPLWASFLRNRKKGDGDGDEEENNNANNDNNNNNKNGNAKESSEELEIEGYLGVLLCNDCAQHHHFELGKRRCLLKYLKYSHEVTARDLDILEFSGNNLVNKYYEANLKKDDFEKDLVVDDKDDEATRRGKFVKNKYKKIKYRDHAGLAKAIEKLQRKRTIRRMISGNPAPVTNAAAATNKTMEENGAAGYYAGHLGFHRSKTVNDADALKEQLQKDNQDAPGTGETPATEETPTTAASLAQQLRKANTVDSVQNRRAQRERALAVGRKQITDGAAAAVAGRAKNDMSDSMRNSRSKRGDRSPRRDRIGDSSKGSSSSPKRSTSASRSNRLARTDNHHDRTMNASTPELPTVKRTKSSGPKSPKEDMSKSMSDFSPASSTHKKGGGGISLSEKLEKVGRRLRSKGEKVASDLAPITRSVSDNKADQRFPKGRSRSPKMAAPRRRSSFGDLPDSVAKKLAQDYLDVDIDVEGDPLLRKPIISKSPFKKSKEKKESDNTKSPSKTKSKGESSPTPKQRRSSSLGDLKEISKKLGDGTTGPLFDLVKKTKETEAFGNPLFLKRTKSNDNKTKSPRRARSKEELPQKRRSSSLGALKDVSKAVGDGPLKYDLFKKLKESSGKSATKSSAPKDGPLKYDLFKKLKEKKESTTKGESSSAVPKKRRSNSIGDFADLSKKLSDGNVDAELGKSMQLFVDIMNDSMQKDESKDNEECDAKTPKPLQSKSKTRAKALGDMLGSLSAFDTFAATTKTRKDAKSVTSFSSSRSKASKNRSDRMCKSSTDAPDIDMVDAADDTKKSTGSKKRSKSPKKGDRLCKSSTGLPYLGPMNDEKPKDRPKKPKKVVLRRNSSLNDLKKSAGGEGSKPDSKMFQRLHMSTLLN